MSFKYLLLKSKTYINLYVKENTPWNKIILGMPECNRRLWGFAYFYSIAIFSSV